MKYSNPLNKLIHIRLQESTRILKKYPDRIPIILLKYNDKSPDLLNYKFLIPAELTLSSLLFHIRKKVKLNEKEMIFLYINNTMYNTSTTIKEIYNKEKNEDQFLYFTYHTENTFG